MQMPNGVSAPTPATPQYWPPMFLPNLQPGQVPQQSFPSLAAAACSAGLPPTGPGWGPVLPLGRGPHSSAMPWAPPFGQPQPGYGQAPVPGLPMPSFPAAPHWPGQTYLPPVQQPASSQPNMIGTLPPGSLQQSMPANGQPGPQGSAAPPAQSMVCLASHFAASVLFYTSAPSASPAHKATLMTRWAPCKLHMLPCLAYCQMLT